MQENYDGDPTNSTGGYLLRLLLEIQLEILQYIPTPNLLKQCRLVSEAWNKFSTSICRNRHLHVNGQKFYEEPSAILNIFQNARNTAWSSVTLSLCSAPQKHTRINDAIAEKFGSQIRKIVLLVLDLNYESIFNILNYMPNLQILEIEDKFSTAPSADTENSSANLSKIFKVPINVPSLRKLRTFKTDYIDNGYVKFIEQILLQSGAKVANLLLSLKTIPGEDFQKLLGLLQLARIPEVSMSLKFTAFRNPALSSETTWKILAAQRVGISVQKLKVVSYEPSDIIVPEEFRILELALSKFKELVELEIIGFCDTAKLPTSTMIKIPQFLKLRKILICATTPLRLSIDDVPAPSQKLYYQVRAITPSDFPEIESVFFLHHSPNETNSRELFDTSAAQFKCVRTFICCQYKETDGWTHVFPNLTKGVLTINEPGFLCLN